MFTIRMAWFGSFFENNLWHSEEATEATSSTRTFQLAMNQWFPYFWIAKSINLYKLYKPRPSKTPKTPATVECNFSVGLDPTPSVAACYVQNLCSATRQFQTSSMVSIKVKTSDDWRFMGKSSWPWSLQENHQWCENHPFASDHP